MKTARAIRARAFTLMEMLMVIAIIAIVASLVVGLASVAGSKKKIARTEAELQNLVTLIESYKAKVGVYPPDNPNNMWGTNTLLYELAGAVRTNAPGVRYDTPFGNVQMSVLQSSFGVAGIINARDAGGSPEDNSMVPLLKNLKPDQVGSVVADSLSLVVPIDGPNGRPNPWRYRSGTNALHNPESFDLWAEIIAGGRTNIVGNWKN